MKMVKFFLKPVVWISLLVLLSLAGGVYGFTLYQKSVAASKQAQNPDAAAKEEIKKLSGLVSKLMELPQGEDPTIATVTDKEKLKDQAFFVKTENGDKLLIYPQAKKAILYRPSTNKVIDVAPVNIGQTAEASGSGSVAGAATKAARIALYNGTATVGLTKTVEKQLVDKVKNIQIVAKENAKKKDYTKTLVVDLNGTLGQAAAQLAQAMGGEVGSLPEGETKPDADLLVILGK